MGMKGRSDLDDVVLAGAYGARAVAVDSNERIVTVLLVTDGEGALNVIAWNLENAPSAEFSTFVNVLKSWDATSVVVVGEVSVVMFEDDGEMLMGDGVVVSGANVAGETRQRIFVLDRSLELGDDNRFAEHVGEDVSRFDTSWVQRGLMVARRSR